MVEDVNVLMEYFGYENYCIWGYSDGGILGLILGYCFFLWINFMLILGVNLWLDFMVLYLELVVFVGCYDEIEDFIMCK